MLEIAEIELICANCKGKASSINRNGAVYCMFCNRPLVLKEINTYVNSANYMQQSANAPPIDDPWPKHEYAKGNFSSADVVFSSVIAFYIGLAAGVAVAAIGFWLF